MITSEDVQRSIPAFASIAIVEEDGETPSPWSQEESLLAATAVEGRRRAFRLGRKAAHQALAELGLDDGPILRGPAGQPLWSQGTVGSITNKESVAAAIVAHNHTAQAVGIDLEFVQPVHEIESLVLRREEASWVSALRGMERQRAVIAVFAAKEAIFKALYPVVLNPFGFDAASLQPRPWGFEATIVKTLHPMYPRDSSVAVVSRWEVDRVLCWVVIRRENGDELGDPVPRDTFNGS